MGIGRKGSTVKMEKETGFDGFKDLMGKVQAKEWHGMAWRGVRDRSFPRLLARVCFLFFSFLFFNLFTFSLPTMFNHY